MPSFQTIQIIFFNFIYLFIFNFWLRWVFVAAHGLSLAVVSGDCSSLWCMGFSLRWLLLLWSTGSRCAGFSSCGSRALELRLSSCGSRALERRLSSCGSRALEHRLSSCGARAWLLRGMWDLPGPGLEPVSPALAGVFLTTVPPGKSPDYFDHRYFNLDKT